MEKELPNSERTLVHSSEASKSHSLVRYLKQTAIPEDIQLTQSTITSILLADPSTTLAAKVFTDATLQSNILRLAGVSLPRASKWVDEIVGPEGSMEMNAAGALSRPRQFTI
jgi:hypothetical protein